MKRRWWVAVLLVGAGLCLGRAVNLEARREAADANDELYKELELFEHALSIVRSDYVEEPDSKQLMYGALKGMLATLDPYSQFLDPDSYNELRVETEGEFGGLGIEITIKDDLLTIISPIDDTPAYRAGLKPGDRIVKIDGEITRGITLLEAVKKLRGEPRTPVVLTILREGDNELKDVSVTRDIIKIESVRDAKILEEHVGYIRVSDFREGTSRDLTDALARLKDEGMHGLIVDVRNNPGGLLDVAVTVTELFLRRDEVVVSTKGRLRNQNLEYRARRDGSVNGQPVVVLINEGSASASEIFAGAIQDHKRGILIGEKSHGKGSVQTVFPMKDGSALRLTTSKWFTPSGRPIHDTGITPDVVVPFEAPPEPKEDGGQKAEDVFEKVNREDGETPEAPKAPLDNQLARALDLVKALNVYETQEHTTR